MRRQISAAFGFAAIVGGSIALPLTSSASSAPAFKMVLDPARVLIDHDGDVTFQVYNLGTEPFHLVESGDANWFTFDGLIDLTMGPDSLHTSTVHIHKPALTDAGDADLQIKFTAVNDTSGGPGLFKVNRGIAATVIYATNVGVVHSLSFADLHLPMVADSFDAPTVSVVAHNHGNVHEILPANGPFPGTLLLRGETKTLTTRWTAHPFLGVQTVRMGSLAASTLFLPFRAVGGFLLALLGLYVVIRTLRPRISIKMGRQA